MILMYIFLHQEYQNNQMRINAPHNLITQHPEKSRGWRVSASCIRQSKTQQVQSCQRGANWKAQEEKKSDMRRSQWLAGGGGE